MKKSAMDEINTLVERYPDLCSVKDDITKALEILIECFESGGKILVGGNGGSAADSEHIVGELMKAFESKRYISSEDKKLLEEMFPEESEYLSKNLQGALPAISLISHTGLMTAYANDMAPDLYMAQQTYGYGKEGDVLFAISTSGNSKNIIYAAQVAKLKKMKIIGLTGSKKCKLEEIAHVNISAPSTRTYQIQEYHLPIYHTICLGLEKHFFND